MGGEKELWGFEYMAANIADRDVRVSLINYGLMQPYISYFIGKKDIDKIKDLVAGLGQLDKEVLKGVYYVARDGNDISVLVPYLYSFMEGRETLKTYFSAMSLAVYYLNKKDLEKLREMLDSKNEMVRSGIANALTESNFAGFPGTEDEKLRFKIRSILIRMNDKYLEEITRLEDKAIPHLIEAGNDDNLKYGNRAWALFMLETLAYNLFVEKRYSDALKVIKESMVINTKAHKKEIEDHPNEKYKMLRERRERVKEMGGLAAEISEILNKLPKPKSMGRKTRPARRKMAAVYR